jgi:translation initiation factor 1
VQQRNGKKCLTIIEGLTEQEVKDIVKPLKKRFCCAGTVIVDDDQVVLQLSGDQRKLVADYLVNDRNYKRNNIKIHGY